jgi:hypothetical protein
MLGRQRVTTSASDDEGRNGRSANDHQRSPSDGSRSRSTTEHGMHENAEVDGQTHPEEPSPSSNDTTHETRGTTHDTDHASVDEGRPGRERTLFSPLFAGKSAICFVRDSGLGLNHAVITQQSRCLHSTSIPYCRYIIPYCWLLNNPALHSYYDTASRSLSYPILS